MQSSVKLKETKNGLSERDLHSKAILNTDNSLLLKYKIQKSRQMNVQNNSTEIERLKSEFQSLKSEISEIKQILLQIASR
jgi:hypothetical protein